MPDTKVFETTEEFKKYAQDIINLRNLLFEFEDFKQLLLHFTNDHNAVLRLTATREDGFNDGETIPALQYKSKITRIPIVPILKFIEVLYKRELANKCAPLNLILFGDTV